MKMLKLPPQEKLREYFDYDETTGNLIWKSRPPRSRITIGKIAGSLTIKNKRQVKIEGIHYTSSRIIWKWVHGTDPTGEIDHKNRDHSNDSINNLRQASHAQNMCNRAKYKGSLPKGVRKVQLKNCTKYSAQIQYNKKWRYLGTFNTVEEAANAYNKAAKKLHGDFARPNEH